ncbi:hypothetical protein [Sulfurovum sp.]|uniref:hypothetical protein n=1 Tax=Sulfurovum sp. TaxID=1969726 RepID=UPI003563EB6C
MKVKSNTDGLKKLAKNAEAMSGTNQVKLKDLMTPKFISKCSNFNDIEHLFNESGFAVESKEDFEAIPDDKWNEFIVENTSFSSWEEMQKEAGAIYVKEQLFKNL